MRVRIHDLTKNINYVASSPADCADAVDESVFDSVMIFGDVVCMGKVIGEPVWDDDHCPSILI